ncbi:hypothetical protein [Deinococcus peraridilitoris]|uniref:Uncharacterized protein n=1 Tax=Deinococcus peraridilitoris (strain DSM 19664 / LMG 22246 / CIP 109416 / KR-200) TaxID=937777 RepID=L0A9Q4_DEIPD|nr:hypothetical protein [Deinococcus peraridilitoris]AFZ69790.1 hypothetical protein Deipe_4465 [Deinococcus peraridilitoris DSM 19664]
MLNRENVPTGSSRVFEPQTPREDPIFCPARLLADIEDLRGRAALFDAFNLTNRAPGEVRCVIASVGENVPRVVT